MDNIKRLKTIVNINIPYFKPKNLEELSSKFENSDKFPNIKSSFEFPPKTIDLVIKLLLNKEYDKLNFFDIARLLLKLEHDELLTLVIDKNNFTQCLQELFVSSKKYIQTLIIKIVTKIYINTEHSFQEYLLINMNSKEFLFIKLCIKKDFKSIYKSIQNKNFKKVLKYLGLHKILITFPTEYQDYLLNQLYKITLTDNLVKCYAVNLLDEEDIESLYRQLQVIIHLIESNQNHKNNNFLDLIIINNLGNIEDISSKWNKLAIPVDLQERYKRLKGLFEFQKFVNIAKYLSINTDLKTSNLSKSGKTSDANRIGNRSEFWSNYDERFSSVKMWVSEHDYKIMSMDNFIDLSNIKQLEDINNEVCMLEFKEHKLIIIEFFRQRDIDISYKSLIIEDDYVSEAKNLLHNYDFSLDLYYKLINISSFKINHDFLWQGWVDKFLSDRNIYPNQSILNGKRFNSHGKITYKKGIGLEQARIDALSNDRVIHYEDIIIKIK